MPLSADYKPDLPDSTPFEIIIDNLTYLGLKIHRNPTFIFNLNVMEFVSKLKTFPLSMIGHINSKFVAPQVFICLPKSPPYIGLLQNIGPDNPTICLEF